MASRESWRRQIAISNRDRTRQWVGMLNGRRRHNERQTIGKEIKQEFLRLEYLKLPLGLIPWGWQTQMAREIGVSPANVSALLRDLGIGGYWPKFTED